jgi:hypothetical protein
LSLYVLFSNTKKSICRLYIEMVAYIIHHVFRLTAEHDLVKKRELRKVVFDFNNVFIKSPLEIFSRSFLRYKDANFL